MPSIDPQDHPRLAAAVAAFRDGRPVLLLDDADRENEADIVAPAETLQHESGDPHTAQLLVDLLGG